MVRIEVDKEKKGKYVKNQEGAEAGRIFYKSLYSDSQSALISVFLSLFSLTPGW